MSMPSATELACWSLDQQHPLTRTWQPDAPRLLRLAREHQIDIDLTTGDELAARRRDRFAPTESIDRLRNRWIEVDPDLIIMLSMRYEGGDPGRGFVDVSATTRELSPAVDVPRIARLARHSFGTLGPQYLRWWTAESATSHPGVVHDKRFLAAPIFTLTAGRSAPEIALRPAVELAHYDEAVTAYRTLGRAHRGHARQAQIESRDGLGDALGNDLLFDILVDDTWAGYAALGRKHRLGLAGFVIVELVLTEAARHRGFGASLTTLLAGAVADRCDPDDVLLGTVHHDNVGAHRAALDGGRHDVGGWLTVPLAGGAG